MLSKFSIKQSKCVPRSMPVLLGLALVGIVSVHPAAADTTQVLAADSTGNGTQLSGSASGQLLTGSTSGRLLNGSAKEHEQLTPSVRLVPPEPAKHILNGTTGVTQFNGQAQSSPGRPVYPAKAQLPAFNPVHQQPRADFFRAAMPARIVIQQPHVPWVPAPVPKWNYTMTPRNGIMTWAPGYQINHIAQPPHIVVQQTQNHSALFQPQTNGLIRSNKMQPGVAAWTSANPKLLQSQSAAPRAVALQATPQLLTELGSNKEKRSVTWEEWYRRVCKVIYDQWLLDAACPGKACVRVTVWSGRDIEGKILTFTPAADTSRDAAKETSFRETALRAINSLSKTETLDFPAQSNRTKVIFDLDMNRSVDGPSGCQVAAFHDAAETASKPAKTTAKTSSKNARIASKTASKTTAKTISKTKSKTKSKPQ